MMCVAIPKAELIDEYQFPASKGSGGIDIAILFSEIRFPRLTDAARQIVEW